MSKSYRQGQILKLIRTKPIHTQDELAQELKNLGIAATQVTLSRDIRELRLVKTRRRLSGDGAGGDRAAVCARWRPSFCIDVRIAQNLVVLQDLPRPRQLAWRSRSTARSGPKWWAPSPATTRFW